MNELELFEFLRQHLNIELEKYYDDWNEKNKLKVILKFDDRIISEDEVSINK
jgi:hypothetical protein